MIHVCASCPWWSQGDLSCLIGLIQTQPVRRRPSRHWGLTAGAENGWARLCQDAKVPADGHRALRVLKCLVNILAAINLHRLKLIVFWHTQSLAHRVLHTESRTQTDTESHTNTKGTLLLVFFCPKFGLGSWKYASEDLFLLSGLKSPSPGWNCA